ncbi:amidohydrolase family protein [Frankia sp. AgB1.9]|uniref:amidohydrolase family protein n=1 Tax=unclassified Frankia TaxID=2632575 RepID=UPI001933E611|nr:MULTISPECIES: amidohydrolase family protein [unclassified Frankia]MBL7493129.1 amidohydrolase family protein [Frankia sp. AgW1.1]MBL7551494.1 amidohydrolase family protein [Frankia sp. AgB1.9]MBL7623609.1 amidohydrolase family protein [Frankia sp. AgB1.8]
MADAGDLAAVSDVAALTTVFDADNHYWESSDAFTRHRDPAFADRGLRVVEVDGTRRYFLGEHPHPILPGPGDAHPRPRPGALYDYFAGRSDKGSIGAELACEVPAEHPEWFNRDARLARMDTQGLEAAWMFPSHAVCLEGPMQPDIEGSLEVLRAFNRWLEEDWGFAYQDRIFGVPYLSLSDAEGAVRELDWCLDHGARVVSIRNGPAFTPDGTRSPADPVFDPFWARVQEAGVVVAPHAGFDDGYREVEAAIARAWGYRAAERGGDTNAITLSEPFVTMLMKHRLVQDFAAALVSHGLFERFPRLRVAYIENGGTWVGPLLHGLELLAAQNPGLFRTSPVEQFVEHCWVAPFVEDDVNALAAHLPARRILFGSDWPHAEGLGEPRDFLTGLAGFSAEDQRRIMVDNARELTFG